MEDQLIFDVINSAVLLVYAAICGTLINSDLGVHHNGAL